MIFHFSIVQVHFVFLSIDFIALFPFLIKYYNILFIIIVFMLGSDKVFSSFFALFLLFSPKGSVTGCDSSRGSFCYSRVILHFAFMHLLSGYYCYRSTMDDFHFSIIQVRFVFC